MVLSPPLPQTVALPSPDQPAAYGEGFAAVYGAGRYAAYSRRLAKLALGLIAEHGAPGRDLLDLACGAGAGTAVFAEAGFRVTGVDCAAAQLAEAEARMCEHQLNVRLVRQDLRSLRVEQRYHVVTCLFDALNYLLDEDELRAAFAGAAAALRRGGLLIFDMNTRHGLTARWGKGTTVRTVRPHCVEINSYEVDALRDVFTVRTSILAPGSGTEEYARCEEVHRERAYSVDLVCEVLVQVGFDVVSTYGLYDRFHGPVGLQALRNDAGRMFVVARPR